MRGRIGGARRDRRDHRGGGARVHRRRRRTVGGHRHVGAGHRQVAEVVVEQVADGARRGLPGRRLLLRVEHLVAERVEHPRDAGADPPGAQHLAVHLGGRRHRRRRDARPLAGEGAVEQPREVDLVDADPAGREAAECGLDAESDDPHLAVLVEEDVLRGQGAVGDPGLVRLGEAVGDLGDEPGRAARGQRTLAGEQDVEGVALAPLVDHEAAPVGGLGVEHPQQPAVDDRAGAARRLEQRTGALVVLGDDVHRDGTVEHEVVGAPEPPGAGLGQQVVEAVALGEHVTGLHRCRHCSPRFPRAFLCSGPL